MRTTGVSHGDSRVATHSKLESVTYALWCQVSFKNCSMDPLTQAPVASKYDSNTASRHEPSGNG